MHAKSLIAVTAIALLALSACTATTAGDMASTPNDRTPSDSTPSTAASRGPCPNGYLDDEANYLHANGQPNARVEAVSYADVFSQPEPANSILTNACFFSITGSSTEYLIARIKGGDQSTVDALGAEFMANNFTLSDAPASTSIYAKSYIHCSPDFVIQVALVTDESAPGAPDGRDFGFPYISIGRQIGDRQLAGCY